MLRDEIRTGLFGKNPLLVIGMGLCPAIAICISLANALMLGMCATLVLMCSSVSLSIVRKMIPERIRVAFCLIVIATYVCIVQLSMKAYFPFIADALGMFIPLLSVNCIILSRAGDFAIKNKPFASFLDGAITGIGYSLALCLVGGIREVLGHNTLLGFTVVPHGKPLVLFLLAPGGFFTIAGLMGWINYSKRRKVRS